MNIVSRTYAAFRKALASTAVDSGDHKNEAQRLAASFGRGTLDYKAPHAPRGTPARQHLIKNRKAQKRVARERAAVGYGQPQPVKYMHSAARRRLSEMKEAA